MLQKKPYSTPTTRFASVLTLFDTTKVSLRKKPNKKNHLLHKKRFFRPNLISITGDLRLNWAFVTETYLYNYKPYQLFLKAKSLFNHDAIFPGLENMTPGTILYNCVKNIEFTKLNYTGSQMFLKDLPFFISVAQIFNNFNNKVTFIKSSGTSGVKLKPKKTIKLVVIKLPSGIDYYFLINTRTYIGKNTNFFNHKFIEGKWGFSLHPTKQLVVRGVAKNPVDHPNGGRTKAKQPEKSPWGWIAKHSK